MAQPGGLVVRLQKDRDASAWLTGFDEGVEQAASLLESFGPESARLAILIRAIGTAEVDEKGNRLHE